MKKSLIVYITVFLLVIVTLNFSDYQYVENPEEQSPEFKKIQLSDKFYAEGVAIGDLNGDAQPDIAAGPYWYEGPDFSNRYEFYLPVEFDPLNYSENFIVEIEDVNGDERPDILMVGFPGEAAYWYENPGDIDRYWERHLIHEAVDNESPRFYDLNRDGKSELVFHTEGRLGFAVQDEADPAVPWLFTPISDVWEWGAFTHGLGIGDIDGDGLEDIIKKEGWWKNPGMRLMDRIWEYHQADFDVDDVGE